MLLSMGCSTSGNKRGGNNKSLNLCRASKISKDFRVNETTLEKFRLTQEFSPGCNAKNARSCDLHHSIPQRRLYITDAS